GPRYNNGRYINEGVDVVYLEKISGVPIRPYRSRPILIDRGVRTVPPGYYVRERALRKNEIKHAEHDRWKYEKKLDKADRKYYKELDKAERKSIKAEEKEWKD